MPKKITYNTPTYATTEVGGSDQTIIFSEAVYFSSASGPVIHQASSFSDDKIIIDGTVRIPSGYPGISIEGSNSTVVVDASGALQGGLGIYATGANTTIENDGLIFDTGFTYGIEATGSHANITNSGAIYAQAGIYSTADHATILNNGNIHTVGDAVILQGDFVRATFSQSSTIASGASGVAVIGATRSSVVNNGLIASEGQTAYNGFNGTGKETLINNGTIRGDVFLGSGNDTFNNLHGKYSGTISGEDGDDTFVINSAKTHIVEAAGGGNDTIKSSVSISLISAALNGSEIENLTLLGTKNLHATGNALGNEITGNSGDNLIDGGAGADILKGGKGDDTFVFKAGNQTDEVTDFGKGHDQVEVSGFSHVHDFAGLMKHATEMNGDVHITIGSDELILSGHAVAELQASDFVFG